MIFPVSLFFVVSGIQEREGTGGKRGRRAHTALLVMASARGLARVHGAEYYQGRPHHSQLVDVCPPGMVPLRLTGLVSVHIQPVPEPKTSCHSGP